MLIEIKEYKPQDNEPYWCDECDWKLVYPQLPDTGKFFRHSGHVINGKNVNQYECICWAVCSDCLNSYKG